MAHTLQTHPRSVGTTAWPAFWRHVAEMMAVMVVGMVGAGAIFLIVVQKGWNEALVSYPTYSLLVMAVGMTAPMVAWMRHRGHDWRNTLEMGAAMALPVIPFLFLVWFDVMRKAEIGGYCAVSCTAMVALMLYRRDVYAMHHHVDTAA
jgi:predicted membrane-bound spermidine synthase